MKSATCKTDKSGAALAECGQGEWNPPAERFAPRPLATAGEAQLANHYAGLLLPKGASGYRSQPSRPAELPSLSLDSPFLQ